MSKRYMMAKSLNFCLRPNFYPVDLRVSYVLLGTFRLLCNRLHLLTRASEFLSESLGMFLCLRNVIVSWTFYCQISILYNMICKKCMKKRWNVQLNPLKTTDTFFVWTNHISLCSQWPLEIWGDRQWRGSNSDLGDFFRSWKFGAAIKWERSPAGVHVPLGRGLWPWHTPGVRQTDRATQG